MITKETFELGCHRRLQGLLSPSCWQDAVGEVDNPLLTQPRMPPVTWPVYKRGLERRSINSALILYLGRPAGIAAVGVSVSQGINVAPSIMSWATEMWQSQITGRTQVQMGTLHRQRGRGLSGKC